MELSRIFFKGEEVWRAYKNRELIWHQKELKFFSLEEIEICSFTVPTFRNEETKHLFPKALLKVFLTTENFKIDKSRNPHITQELLIKNCKQANFDLSKIRYVKNAFSIVDNYNFYIDKSNNLFNSKSNTAVLFSSFMIEEARKIIRQENIAAGIFENFSTSPSKKIIQPYKIIGFSLRDLKISLSKNIKTLSDINSFIKLNFKLAASRDLKKGNDITFNMLYHIYFSITKKVHRKNEIYNIIFSPLISSEAKEAESKRGLEAFLNLSIWFSKAAEQKKFCLINATEHDNYVVILSKNFFQDYVFSTLHFENFSLSNASGLNKANNTTLLFKNKNFITTFAKKLLNKKNIEFSFKTLVIFSPTKIVYRKFSFETLPLTAFSNSKVERVDNWFLIKYAYNSVVQNSKAQFLSNVTGWILENFIFKVENKVSPTTENFLQSYTKFINDSLFIATEISKLKIEYIYNFDALNYYNNPWSQSIINKTNEGSANGEKLSLEKIAWYMINYLFLFKPENSKIKVEPVQKFLRKTNILSNEINHLGLSEKITKVYVFKKNETKTISFLGLGEHLLSLYEKERMDSITKSALSFYRIFGEYYVIFKSEVSNLLEFTNLLNLYSYNRNIELFENFDIVNNYKKTILADKEFKIKLIENFQIIKQKNIVLKKKDIKVTEETSMELAKYFIFSIKKIFLSSFDYAPLAFSQWFEGVNQGHINIQQEDKVGLRLTTSNQTVEEAKTDSYVVNKLTLSSQYHWIYPIQNGTQLFIEQVNNFSYTDKLFR